MDLVDIDQVLDNLELTEAAEEQNYAVNYNNPKQQEIQSSDTKTTISTKYVNNRRENCVSQVFTHLDDYQKNVKALEKVVPKYDIDCPLPVTTSIGRYEDSPSTSPYSNNPSTSYVHKRTIYDLNKHNDDDDDEEEEEATNDINKFTESTNSIKNATDYNDDDSSGSLTTSSSSTFSSGPSAGAASTTDERVSPISPVSKNSEDTHLIPSSTQTEETHSEVADDETNRFRNNATNDEESKVVDVEDLATGVSSISISNTPSILPCETSASSVLHKVLNELSEEEPTSILPLSQPQENISEQPTRDIENSKAIMSISISEQNRNGHSHHQEEEKLEITKVKKELELRGLNGIVSCNVQHVPTIPAIQQPITFGSTMDEISDTELDSMLQEMDIDAEDEIDSNCNKSPTKTNQSMQIIKENLDLDVAKKSTIDDKNLQNNDNHHQENSAAVLMKDHDDDEHLNQDSINADSFSQASTVEFSEIRPQNNTMPTTPEETNSQYENANSDCEENHPEVSIEVEEHTSNVEVDEDVDDENAIPASRPQRPTTLNLPTLKSNLHTNAGQTPPGTTTTDIDENNVNLANDSSNITQEIAEATGYSDPNENLGRVPPIWVPDNMATGCMQCQTKFTMIKRRHHCRACGKVLCSLCCSQKFKLEFSNEPESRVCVQCYLILAQRQQQMTVTSSTAISSLNDLEQQQAAASTSSTATAQVRSPNPNNPMEYCSTIPPHRQVSGELAPPPTVIVPVGVLKKEGSYSSNSSNSSTKQTRKRKSVMFSDGIAPGSDLAMMEQHQWVEAKHARRIQQTNMNKPPTPIKSESNTDAHTLGMVAQLFRGSIPPISSTTNSNANGTKTQANVSPKKVPKLANDLNSTRSRRLPPSGCDDVGCFIPQGNNNNLPPLYITKDETGCDYDYKDVSNDFELMQRLKQETLKFALTRNFFVFVKILNLKCCLNRMVINFTTNGMHHVGNDEIIILLEYEPPSSKELMTEPPLPKDIFVHLHEIYREAELGNPIAELSYTWPRQEPFLGTHEYGGFIFIRPTFQCLLEVIVPENPFLIGILIHRSEVPWAKVFPLRLILRLGAQYRYYPCPHVSMRKRDSVYAEIAQTIINFLADFRNYSYTLPNIRGMYIHMEDRLTTVLIPRNRQEDVIKAMNNSSDHILAFAGNFSKAADGHLVCMQNTNDERTEMYSYSTQAINIQGQPRKVTGASFFVLNESLKSTSGLSAKCSIVEDGLMVQIMPTKMEEVRNALSTQKDIDILCGPINADEQQREIVSIKWVDNDKDFNIGVKSPIDNKSLEGISSMRVHASFSYANTNYSIRLTDIFILKFDDWYTTSQAALAASSADITRIAEQVARSASMALVPFLDLLVASGNSKIGLRVTLHQDNVCYEAGARGCKLPPLYMNALDNNLVPTLHNESTGMEDAIILELIFYILNV